MRPEIRSEREMVARGEYQEQQRDCRAGFRNRDARRRWKRLASKARRRAFKAIT
jgi:hypothetical protein